MTKRKIKPAKKIVIVKPTKLKDSGTGSILAVVNTEKKKPELGRIIGVGEGKLPIPMKKGDIIAYRAYAGSSFFLWGMEVIFVGFDDVLGVIKEK